MEEDWVLNAEIDEAGSTTLNRLHLLVQKGYQPDFDGEPLGAIWLYHPRESFRHKLLILYGSGLVVSSYAKSDEYRFERGETQAFERFLKAVPTPSFWERTRRGRVTVYVWLIIGSWWLGCAVAAMAAMELVRAFFR
jgi:hypothetical protein